MLLHGLRELRNRIDRLGSLLVRHGPTGTVVVASARTAERDVVAVTKLAFAVHALGVDVSSVQAAKVAQDVRGAAPFDDAVLLGYDLVEQLDRIARVPAEGVEVAQ